MQPSKQRSFFLAALLPVLACVLGGCEKKDPVYRANVEMTAQVEGLNLVVDVKVGNLDPRLITECGIRWNSRPDKEDVVLDQDAKTVKSQAQQDRYRFEIFPWDKLVATEGKIPANQCTAALQAYVRTAGGEIYTAPLQNRFTTDIWVSILASQMYFEEGSSDLIVPCSIYSYYSDQLKGLGVLWSPTLSWDVDRYTKIPAEAVDGGDFTVRIPGVENVPDGRFYCIAYAETELGTLYTLNTYFRLPGGDIDILMHANFTDLTFERGTVYANATVKNPTAYPITERGFCYLNTREITSGRMPTIDDGRLALEGGNGKYSGTITGLKAGAAYKVRAYAINSRGITYSNNYTTLPMYTTEAFVPMLYSLDAKLVAGMSDVSLTSRIDSDHGYLVTERGFCYSRSGQTPTVNDMKIQAEGSGLGTFSAVVKDLAPGRYFFRSYAVNEAGVGYFIGTPKEVVVPGP